MIKANHFVLMKIPNTLKMLQEMDKDMNTISKCTNCIKYVAKIFTSLGLILLFAAGMAMGKEAGGQTYRVIGVSASDPEGLNVRGSIIEAQSVGDTNVVGHLEWNQKGIISSGLVVEIGGSIWREIPRIFRTARVPRKSPERMTNTTSRRRAILLFSSISVPNIQ